MTAVAAAEEEEAKEEEGEGMASRPTKSRRVTLSRPSVHSPSSLPPHFFARC